MPRTARESETANRPEARSEGRREEQRGKKAPYRRIVHQPGPVSDRERPECHEHAEADELGAVTAL
jgi:hypothetical protein